MRSMSKIRRYIACLLVVMLLMCSGLEGLPGAIVSARGEETDAEAVEAAEAETATPVPAEAPTAVPTEVPTQEPEADQTAVPETTEAATAAPAPAETLAITDMPAQDPAEAPLEELHFSEGYVRLEKDSIVYKKAKEAEELGTLKAKGIVYAALAEEASDPAEDWLKITFDTQALRESSADFAVGYVRYKMVEALTDEEAAELIGELEKDEDARWEKDGKFHVPCVVFEEEEADPEASDVTPEAGSPSESSGATEAERIGRTAASNVNVRSEATTQSERVTTIAEAGTEVAVTGETEADGAVWYAIRYEGFVGYIRSDLIEVEAQPAANKYAATARMGTADPDFGDTVEYVGGVVADGGAPSSRSLSEELTVAYVTLLSSALEVGQEASWRVTASGGTTPYTYYYCLFRQDLEDTSNLYTSVSGSILTTTSDTYAFTISEEGRYFLQFRITDANGDSLTFQSPTYETPSEELSAKVQEIVNACAGEGKSDYQKALALHDWLCENASYDDTLTIHDPSGVLLQGTGVCESFALAYQMLLTEAGVENVYVTGTANGGGHSWNMVKLDGEWYHVDVTWDEDGTDRYYFGMSTALISRDHVIEDRVPTAAATKYNYAMNASDGAFASLDELGGLFEQLPASQASFKFYYTGSDNINTAYQEWVLANAATYGITSYGCSSGDYTRYVSGTKEAQEAPVEAEATKIIGVWYDKGIEERPLQIHVTTSLDAQYLYLYQGDNLLASWSADEADIDVYATCKEWHVSYTFAYSGAYYLWYKASADGTAMSDAYTPDPVEIERPAVIDVWYEKGIEAEPLKIHATTNLDMQYLYLYLGDDQIGSWSAEDAEIVEYATCKEWIVDYTFADPGAYYLWYKASADGTELSLPYSPAAAQIERPAVIEVWYEKGLENTPLKIHATTNLDMQYLYLYLGEEQLGIWSAADAEIVEYATCKEWVIEHTFTDPGAYYLWYKASVDGAELSQAYAPEPAQIERPAVIEVWYEEAAVGTPLKIHATTNLQMQYLYLYLGEEQLEAWTAEESAIVEYATCKEWTVEHMFADPGAYYLWYKASKDGTTEELPYAPDPAYIRAAGDELAAPEWESIAQENLTAVLCWQAVEGADGYEISMSEGGSDEYSVIGETAGATTLTTGALTVGATYAFRIRAYAQADGEKVYSSLFSDIRSLTVESPLLVFNDFTYTLNEDGTGVVIASYLGSEADVVVPDAIEGIPVTEIGDDAFLNNVTLIRITLPQTVERISARAFKNCTALCEMD